jgi:glycosyltransferase involved in cell wall biosynthesis
VTHGETGLLFRKADIDDLADKTVLAAGDPALRARMGRQARRYVERYHDIDHAVDQYMALLQLQCGL